MCIETCLENLGIIKKTLQCQEAEKKPAKSSKCPVPDAR